jgi:hypothetical protein
MPRHKRGITVSAETETSARRRWSQLSGWLFLGLVGWSTLALPEHRLLLRVCPRRFVGKSDWYLVRTLRWRVPHAKRGGEKSHYKVGEKRRGDNPIPAKADLPRHNDSNQPRDYGHSLHRSCSGKSGFVRQRFVHDQEAKPLRALQATKFGYKYEAKNCMKPRTCSNALIAPLYW